MTSDEETVVWDLCSKSVTKTHRKSTYINVYRQDVLIRLTFFDDNHLEKATAAAIKNKMLQNTDVSSLLNVCTWKKARAADTTRPNNP